MALYQGLQQKLQQKLSPQQIQLMKLLQVPTALLEERLKEEIEENPALEIGEEKAAETDDDASDELDLDLPEGEDEPTDDMEDPLQYEDYGDDESTTSKTCTLKTCRPTYDVGPGMNPSFNSKIK